ncbi:hypothetical protein [Parasphingorhabdus pacifica]
MGALDDVRRQLYSADPTEFVGVRDRLAAEARDRGDGETAAEIKKLRRPGMAAHAVNLLAWHESERVDRLVELGEQMRSAQRNLRGDEVRQLDEERSGLQVELIDRAVELTGAGGRSLGEQARRQVEQTLHAAVSDPEAARQVCSGALTAPVEYSGFGLDEVSAAALRNRSNAAESKDVGRSRRDRSRKGSRSGESGAAERTREVEAGAARAEGSPRSSARRKKNTRKQQQPAAGNAAMEEKDAEEARDETRRSAPDRLDEELRRAREELRHAESEQDRAARRHERLRGRFDEIELELRDAEQELDRARERVDEARKRCGDAETRRPGSHRKR